MNRFDLICLALAAASWTVLYFVLRGRSITISFSSPAGAPRQPVRSRRQRETVSRPPIQEADPLALDVESALINQGVRKDKAAQLARRACQEHPGDFNGAFLAAVREAA